MTRTTNTIKEERIFDFPMTDADVLDRVSEINDLRSKENILENQKKSVAGEIKTITAKANQIFSNIANREEPREVECDVKFDYEERMVYVTYDEEELSRRKMTNWEYETRPADIYPKIEETEVSTGERAEEIAEKAANMTVVSADVNAFSEAQTETAVEGLSV